MSAPQPAGGELRTLEANLRLSQSEYFLRRSYLRSMPRMLGLVLGNACNLDCPHCYQEKNGDNLLHPVQIGQQFRRELLSLYPYLSTLRVQGGEVLAYRGFREIVEDVAAVTRRPLLSISTNGTLIDDEWAEKMVRLPFSSATVSIDGGTPETYAKLRRGSELPLVLANVARIRKWKEKLNSARPELDSFFVILRSNFREIPQYLELARENGFVDVALQTAEFNRVNSTREPVFAEQEAIANYPGDVAELYALTRDVLPRAREWFRIVRLSGLQSLFEKHGYDASFLRERENGLYPDSADLSTSAEGSFELCPNPWTTLFVAENGNVHLCFLAEPVGNLYEAPLVEIWNSPPALAKRLRMIRGAYMASGCSSRWCAWREGQAASPMKAKAEPYIPVPVISEDSAGLPAVRRMLAGNNRRLHEAEQALRAMDEEFQRMRRSILVRAAAHVARKWERVKSRMAGIIARSR